MTGDFAIPADPDDPADLVRRGYDALSCLYRAGDAGAGRYGPWLEQLLARLPPACDVLDLGCGCGVPTALALASAGHRVTGVDFSEVQVRRAREHVPQATFIQADMTRTEFGPASFGAIVSLYAIIHVPLEAQPGLLRRAARWLAPGGWLLMVAGQRAWTGRQEGWLDGPAPMWWSQADAATYRGWLEDSGLRVTEQAYVPEGDSGHALFWACKPAS